jgi:hypothetical protein
MKNISFSTAITVLAGMTLGACGIPKTSPVPTRSLQLPDYGSAKDFSLANMEGTRTFSGQILIWDPQVTRTGVENILRLKRIANESAVTRKRNLDQYMDTVLAPAVSTLETKLSEKDTAEKTAATRVRTNSIAKAESWFDVSAQKNLRADMTANAQIAFTRYCEAKLYSFATTSILAEKSFTSRPTPSALCEANYRALGFFNDASCADSPEGRNYFSCIWKAGVLKTSFATRYSPLQLTKLEEVATSPDFARIFSGSLDKGCALFPVGGDRTKPFRKVTANTTLINYILNGTKVGAKGEEFDCNGLSAVNFLLKSENTLNSSSPQKVSDDLEFSNPNCDTQLCFVPAKVGETVATTEETTWGTSVSRKLMAFSNVSLSCDENDKPTWFNQNFVTFNAPLLSSSLNRNSCSTSTANELPDVFANDALVEELKATVTALRADLQAKKMKACISFDPACDPESSYNKEWEIEKQTANAASSAALEKGNAIAVVTGFTIKTVHASNGSVLVNVALESTKAKGNWSTCLVNGQNTSCPSDSLRLDSKPFVAAFDQQSGMLTLDIPVEDIRLFGHESYSDTPEKVHPLVARDFVGRTLHLELVPAVMGNLLPYFSGKANIRQSQKDLYQGVSFLMDTALTEKHESIYSRF